MDLIGRTNPDKGNKSLIFRAALYTLLSSRNNGVRIIKGSITAKIKVLKMKSAGSNCMAMAAGSDKIPDEDD